MFKFVEAIYVFVFTRHVLTNCEITSSNSSTCHGVKAMLFSRKFAINVYVHQVFSPIWYQPISHFVMDKWVYELQFCSHNDAKHICTKMRQVMGASVCSLTPIKSTIHVGASLGLSRGGGKEGVKKRTSTFNKISEVFKSLGIGGWHTSCFLQNFV